MRCSQTPQLTQWPSCLGSPRLATAILANNTPGPQLRQPITTILSPVKTHETRAAAPLPLTHPPTHTKPSSRTQPVAGSILVISQELSRHVMNVIAMPLMPHNEQHRASAALVQEGAGRYPGDNVGCYLVAASECRTSPCRAMFGRGCSGPSGDSSRDKLPEDILGGGGDPLRQWLERGCVRRRRHGSLCLACLGWLQMTRAPARGMGGAERLSPGSGSCCSAGRASASVHVHVLHSLLLPDSPSYAPADETYRTTGKRKQPPVA